MRLSQTFRNLIFIVVATAAPVFVSSVVHQEQILHRVRLGPIESLDEATQLEQSVRVANLGNPRRVRID